VYLLGAVLIIVIIIISIINIAIDLIVNAVR
jgi:hypothetical protein